MKLYFIIFTIGLVLGIYLSFMYLPLLNYPASPSTFKTTTKTIQKEVTKSEAKYVKSFDSLKKHNAKLETELSATKKSLVKAKEKSHAIRLELYSLLDKRFERQVDSFSVEQSCDTLISAVNDLMQTTIEKDSLYESVTANLEEQVKNKDSTITVKNLQYAEIKSALTKSMEGQHYLLEKNKFFDKEAKKHKIKSKVLSAALFIFTGIAANHLLNH